MTYFLRLYRNLAVFVFGVLCFSFFNDNGEYGFRWIESHMGVCDQVYLCKKKKSTGVCDGSHFKKCFPQSMPLT